MKPLSDFVLFLMQTQKTALSDAKTLTDKLTQQRTELRQVNQKLAAQYAVTRILEESSTFSEAAVKILAAIGKAVDYQVGVLWTLDKDSNLLRCQEVWKALPDKFTEFESITRMLTFALGVGLPGRVWQSCELIWTADITKDNSPRKFQAFEAGLHAAFGLPIKQGSELIAILEFLSDKTFQPDNSLLKMMVDLGIKIGQFAQSKNIEEALRKQAFQDELTGLSNRHLFMDRLGRAIGLAKQRENYLFAILFLDLDRFKLINDSLGHLVGDQLLIGISRRLETCIRSGDTIARLGGDEFAILLENINDVSCATLIAQRIYKELILPFNLCGQEVFVGTSIGIAIGTADYERPEDLLRDADIAMYRSKELGKADYQVFNRAMHSRTMARLQLETNLRRAIERQEFQLHYQPIVSLQTRRITGFEALVRWQHPERGLVSPSEFIPIAEETKLIIPLGWWVLRQACRQMRTWQVQFPDTSLWKISVNISGKQFSQPNLIEQVKQILQETGFDGRKLKLEITESVLVENSESAIAMLEQLQALGIQLSMDDFGTGYSSLSYLYRFPINTLKVDRSFINSLDVSAEKLAIVRTIVTLAGDLGMDVVAEGVETENQLALLKELKCEGGQGYLFSKPLDSKTAEALIAAEFIN